MRSMPLPATFPYSDSDSADHHRFCCCCPKTTTKVQATNAEEKKERRRGGRRGSRHRPPPSPPTPSSISFLLFLSCLHFSVLSQICSQAGAGAFTFVAAVDVTSHLPPPSSLEAPLPGTTIHNGRINQTDAAAVAEGKSSAVFLSFILAFSFCILSLFDDDDCCCCFLHRTGEIFVLV